MGYHKLTDIEHLQIVGERKLKLIGAQAEVDPGARYAMDPGDTKLMQQMLAVTEKLDFLRSSIAAYECLMPMSYTAITDQIPPSCEHRHSTAHPTANATGSMAKPRYTNNICITMARAKRTRAKH